MYEAYWGLSGPLFTRESAKQSLANSPVHAEALARLDFLLESKCAFGLVLGSSGTGKTTLLAEFAEQTERKGLLVAFVNAAVADEQALLTPLAIGLKVDAGGGAAQLWRRIVERLEELALESLNAVVLLDDLDRAGGRVLSLVERLLAVGTCLTVVGGGRPESAERLGPRLLDQVALRIDLSPWNETETREYLNAGLGKSGRQPSPFDDGAARRLFELSGGAPRKVNRLAELALIAGAGQQLGRIDEATIDAVQEELSVGR